jgi:NADPH-dependent 2,4-dienoyl-CoA reductase/sulfur reductase-like enzyme
MTDRSNARASVVVVGGGYGGINAAKALDDVADVTLVDPTEAFVHNLAAWRALVEPEWLDRIFLPYEHLLQSGRFLRDRAVNVDGRRVTLASGDVLEPEYLVLATGSSYPFPAKTEEPNIASARLRFARGIACRRARADRRRRPVRARARRGDQVLLSREARDDRGRRRRHPHRSL